MKEFETSITEAVGICRLGIPMGIISWTTPVRIVCSLGVRVMYGLLENGRTDGFETRPPVSKYSSR
jgi:hypothetical protein